MSITSAEPAASTSSSSSSDHAVVNDTHEAVATSGSAHDVEMPRNDSSSEAAAIDDESDAKSASEPHGRYEEVVLDDHDVDDDDDDENQFEDARETVTSDVEAQNRTASSPSLAVATAVTIAAPLGGATATEDANKSTSKPHALALAADQLPQSTATTTRHERPATARSASKPFVPLPPSKNWRTMALRSNGKLNRLMQAALLKTLLHAIRCGSAEGVKVAIERGVTLQYIDSRSRNLVMYVERSCVCTTCEWR